MHLGRRVRLGALAILAAIVAASGSGGWAQGAADTVPQTTEDALQGMVQQAAVIFAGQVIAVRRHEGTNGATGVVEVEFAVQDAVRGVHGSTYILREWAGLWAGGGQPLRAGRLYLMLLHAPSALGLSSPVGGEDGAIPIREAGLGGTPEAEPRAAGLVPPADERIVDLRWIATRVVRPITRTTAHPTALPAGVRANMLAGASVQEAAPVTTTEVPPAPLTESADYASVLTLVRGWVKANDGIR